MILYDIYCLMLLLDMIEANANLRGFFAGIPCS